MTSCVNVRCLAGPGHFNCLVLLPGAGEVEMRSASSSRAAVEAQIASSGRALALYHLDDATFVLYGTSLILCLGSLPPTVG